MSAADLQSNAAAIASWTGLRWLNSDTDHITIVINGLEERVAACTKSQPPL